jgi:hypothetical protein
MDMAFRRIRRLLLFVFFWLSLSLLLGCVEKREGNETATKDVDKIEKLKYIVTEEYTGNLDKRVTSVVSNGGYVPDWKEAKKNKTFRQLEYTIPIISDYSIIAIHSGIINGRPRVTKFQMIQELNIKLREQGQTSKVLSTEYLDMITEVSNYTGSNVNHPSKRQDQPRAECAEEEGGRLSRS